MQAATLPDLVFHQTLTAALAGDRHALETVLAKSRQDLRRYAEYHCSVNDVEDAVQESLMLVARKIGDLRAIEAYASWLFRIVKRECNRMKRGMRHILMAPADLAEIESPAYPTPTGLTRDVAGVLAALPAHYRQIILMRDLEGRTIAEIAAALRLHPEAAKARLHRARSLARQYLRPQNESSTTLATAPSSHSQCSNSI